MWLFLLNAFSCVDPYQPEIGEVQDLLVVNGNITDEPGEHIVEVSLSSPYNSPENIPVPGCVVHVEDNFGEGKTYLETSPGIYSANLDKPFLAVGKAYKLFVFTPDGGEYQSDYDSILPCPDFTSLEYRVEVSETEDPEKDYYGIQFYADSKGDGGDSRNFLWKLVEAFEYHSPYWIQYIWDYGDFIRFVPATDSLLRCYTTQQVKEVYTASTTYLLENELGDYPLSYVSNRTNKLRYKYSLLATMHSLSEDAFVYWDRITASQREGGSLYETQPSGLTGNIYNVIDPEEKVLGYFYASQPKSRRLTTKERFEFPIPTLTCSLDTVWDLNELSPDHFHYMISLSEMLSGPPYGTGDRSCFNCLEHGGVLEAPEYWFDDD